MDEQITIDPVAEVETSDSGSDTPQMEDAPAAYGHALERLRAAYLEAEPELDAALLSGETVDEVEANFTAAREMLRRARETARRDSVTIPAGAPGRTIPVPASPIEKIRAGLGRL